MIEVKPGDVFVAGPHRFSCSDIEKENCCELLDIPEKIYMVYSDPPWNPGNAKMWRTISKLDGGVGRAVNWDNFLSSLIKCILFPNPEHIFIESGVKQTQEFIEHALKNGFPAYQKTWNVFYNYTHPNRISYFSNTNTFSGNPWGMKNEPMTRHVFEHLAESGKIVFDPCIGLGMTARMAHNFNMICYGNELNPKRLEKTLLWLANKGYEVKRT